MKVRKTFYFNDGMAGVVTTSTINRAIKILCKNTGFKIEEVKKYLSMDADNLETWLQAWYVDTVKTYFKRGYNGWCE